MRRLVLILAIVLASCTGVPTSDWCYVYNLASGTNSAGVPFTITDGTVTGSGIQTADGYLYASFSEAFTVSPTAFSVTVSNTSGATIASLNYYVSAFGNVYGDLVSVSNGTTTFNVDSLSNSGTLVDVAIETGGIPLTVVSATVYGNGANPYPVNNCAPTPTETPPPAPTETPPAPTDTPTVTPTETPAPYVYATITAPDDPDGEGTMTRFDYVVSVGDVMTAFLLLALLISVWAMFVYQLVASRGE